MFQEHHIFPTGNKQLVISTFTLALCIFIGLLIIFLADGFDTIRYILGISLILFGKGYFFWSYYRTINKRPILKLNPIGIWFRKKNKLIPWAMIAYAVIRKSSTDIDQLYESTLEIKLSDSKDIIIYPISNMAITPHELNKILGLYNTPKID